MAVIPIFALLRIQAVVLLFRWAGGPVPDPRRVLRTHADRLDVVAEPPYAAGVSSPREKAELLERLAERADLTVEERAVLREAAALFGFETPHERSREAPAPRATKKKRARAGGAAAILWSDGAARGNPGPAGVGAIIKTPDGDVLAEVSDYLGHTTNNVAEYRALLAGLERAVEIGIDQIEVRADSELMIKQLKGQYRVKNAGLKPLYEQARELLSRFASVKLSHVRREHNSEADRLANLGIDSR